MAQSHQLGTLIAPNPHYEQTRLEEDYNQRVDHELDQLVDNLSNILRSSKVLFPDCRSDSFHLGF